MLRVRLPFAVKNGHWLKDGRSITPVWSDEHQCWELPKTWFNGFVTQALNRYGKLYVTSHIVSRKSVPLLALMRQATNVNAPAAAAILTDIKVAHMIRKKQIHKNHASPFETFASLAA